MATNTPRLALRKPGGADNVNVLSDLDANFDILDKAMLYDQSITATAINQYFGPFAASTGVGIRARMLFGADVVFMSEADATTPDVGMILRSKGAGVVQLQNSTSQPVITVGVNAGNRTLGFFGGGPITKPTVTGSRSANAALASLINQLVNFGLITDTTTV